MGDGHFIRNGCDLDCGGGDALSGSGEGDGTGGRCCADDGDGMAFVELAFVGLEGVVVEEVAVVNGDYLSGAIGGEVDDGRSVGDDGAVGVDECDGCIGYVVSVRAQGRGFGGEEKQRWAGLPRGAELVCGDDFVAGWAALMEPGSKGAWKVMGLASGCSFWVPRDLSLRKSSTSSALV